MGFFPARVIWVVFLRFGASLSQKTGCLNTRVGVQAACSLRNHHAQQSADKPGSVWDSHSSRRSVATALQQPTRVRCEPHHGTLFGLAPNGVWPAAKRCRLRGALLPHLFTLTCAVRTRPSAVLLSVPLSVASRRPAVSRHSALRSPDFPPRRMTCAATVCPTVVRGQCNRIRPQGLQAA